jgi:1-acyl-sn-glycerol-3-phosphate acyltransferase
LPVAIKGNFEIMPVGKSFPKFKKIVKINVGKPLEFKKELEIGRNLNPQSPEYKEICQRITQRVMEEIRKLFDKL